MPPPRPSLLRTLAGPRVLPSAEGINSQHVNNLQQAKNGRNGAITTSSAAKNGGPGSGISVFSQNREAQTPEEHPFVFYIYKDWEEITATNKMKAYNCWLPVDLDEPANNEVLNLELYRQNPLQQLLVKLVVSWPEWAKYCQRYKVQLDIEGRNATGISLLRRGKGVPLGPVAWPAPPNQFTTLRQAFRDLPKILGISVVDAEFISRSAPPPTAVKRDPSVRPRTSLAPPEFKIKTEPEYALPKRTTALPDQVQVVDLISDTSDSDGSFPELSDVLSPVVKKEANQDLPSDKQVLIKPVATRSHKRERSLSTYQPPSTSTKRSKPAKPTKSAKGSERTKLLMKARGKPVVVVLGQESEEKRDREEGGFGLGLGEGGQETLGLWEKLGESEGDSEGEQSEGDKSAEEKGKQTKSGRHVNLPQRFV